MIITCALSPFTSLPSSSVASTGVSAPSTGQSAVSVMSLSQKINNAIKTTEDLKKSLETKQTNENTYFTDDDSKRLSDCHSKLSALEIVQKLAEFADQLDTKNNNDNNILSNLCTGLQTFLGFNSATKGYTGEGIVYSDLDRLCDGVMGFLSGVLGAVKDENEVTTYDNKDTRSNLSSVLKKLQSSIGTGRAGLVDAVGAVREWLEGYGNTLWTSTSTVSRNIESLKNDIKTVYTNTVETNKSDTLVKQLSAWKQVVNDIETYSNNHIISNVDKLDSALKSRIESEMKPVISVMGALKMSAGNKVFGWQASQVERHLAEEQDRVLQTTHMHFNKISHEIDRLKKCKLDHITAMKYELAETRNYLLQTNEIYKSEVIQRFTDMLPLLNNLNIKQESGKDSNLKIQFDKVKGKVEGISRDMYDANEKLESWKTAADTVVLKAVVKCDQILQKVDKTWNTYGNGASGPEIYTKAKSLKEKAENLRLAARSVKSQVGEQVRSVLESVDRFDGHLKTDLGKVKSRIDSAMRDFVDGLKIAMQAAIGGAKYYGGIHGLKMLAAKLTSTDKLKEKLELLGQKLTDLSLTNNGLALNLEHALHHLQQAQNKSPGTPDFDALARALQEGLTSSIEEILNDTIGEDREGDGKVDKLDALQNYKTQIDTSQSHKSGQSEHLTGSLPLAIKYIRTVVTRKLTDEGIESILENDNTFKEPFESIEEQLQQITECVDGAKQAAALKIYPELKLEGVKNYLNDLQQLISDGAESGYTLQAKYSADVKATVEGLLRIKNTLSSLKSRITKVTAAESEELDALMKDLEGLPDLVETARQEATNRLDRFLSDVKMRIQNIEAAVTRADESLNQYIVEVQDVVHSAQSNIKITVRSAFNKLTTEVRSLFAEQHKADLEALHKCVESQLKAVKEIIRDDSFSGLKGFMKRFNENQNNLSEIIKLVEPSKLQLAPSIGDFKSMAQHVQSVADSLLDYTENQVKTPVPGHPSEKLGNHLSTKLHDAERKFVRLLDHLRNIPDDRKYIYDNQFTSLLSHLSSSLASLHPSHFANPRHPELLDAVKKGLEGFVDEMERVYVNGYEGHQESIDMSKLVYKEGKLTINGKNLSKVFLTILETLYHDFDGLQGGCKTNAQGNKQHICLYVQDKNKQNSNRLGSWLKERGFVVPSTKDKQDGELNSKKTGKDIYGDMLIKKLENASSNTILTTWKKTKNSGTTGSISNDDINLLDILRFFHEHLIKYFETSHLHHIPAPKAPCNIYQMLQWLTGLRHNPMYDKLVAYLKGLFKQPEKSKENEFSAYKLESTETKLNADELSTMLRKVCNISVDVLVAIQGHGHADGVYAVDFYTNQSNITYPRSAGACFDMLVDVSNRVYEQLTFIYKICQNGPESGGWRDCQYGQHVAGSAWNCNRKQCANQTCPQVADQNSNQNANQNGDQNAQKNCDRHPTCGVKSPLQSFLEDGLQGFLPHQFKAPGCKLECAVPNHFGKPCKTPMGFRDIGLVASHTQNGTHLRDAVFQLCGNISRPLTRFCAFTKCLLKTPPQTLGDIFGFFQGYLANWNGGNPANKELLTHKSVAFKKAVMEAYFGNEYNFNLPSLLASSSHKNKEGSHKKGDLFSIVTCEFSDEATCGMYVQSINLNLYSIFAASNNKQYLSWVVYITETFYALLKALLDECCKNCDTAGTRCHDKSCVEDCEVKGYYDLLKSNNTQAAVKELESKNHKDKCHSIVECQNTHPTLYKYGFTFGSQHRLSGSSDSRAKKRTCKDFCSALKSILNDNEEVGAALAKLVYRTIPEYLWKVREPFSYLVLSLWLLSLLYLTHIMVIRLDLLHIKSHLHSPSSHRIAAQSLLAAGRVNKLNRVFYLQP